MATQELLASKSLYYTVGCFVLIISIFSIIINLVTLVGFTRVFKCPKQRLINLNLLSLTLSNIGVSISFPFIIDACFNLGWRMGQYYCDLTSFLTAIFCFTQIFVMCDITLQRYYAICYLISPYISRKIQFCRLSSIWILAVFLGCLPFFNFGDFCLNGIRISCTYNYESKDIKNILYVILLIVAGFVIPFSIILFCYIRIIQATKLSRCRLFHGNLAEIERNSALIRIREYKLAKTAAKAILCFLGSWFPYVCIATSTLLGMHAPSWLESVAAIMAKASSSLTTFVYVSSHKDFKAFYKKFLCVLKLPNIGAQYLSFVGFPLFGTFRFLFGNFENTKTITKT